MKKAYNEQLKKLTEERDRLQNELNDVKCNIGQVQKRIEIDKLTLEEMVTDHAVVRYLERVVGLDITQFKKAILGAHENTIKQMQTLKIKASYGELVVSNGKIVTIQNCN